MAHWKKKIGIGLLALMIAAATGFVVLRSMDGAEGSSPPIFVALEPLTVNLQSNYGDRYLHTAITLELASRDQMSLIQSYLPEIRNQILLLLSAQRPDPLTTVDGRMALGQQLQVLLNQSLQRRTGQSPITAVLFTAFIVQ